MPGKRSSFSSRWRSFFSGLRRRRKQQSLYSALGWFVARAIVLYALLFWGWSYFVPTYIGIITPIANKELQILGVENITRVGSSPDPGFEIGVYHRRAAGMQDSLFDFKLESIHSHLPMVLALILAMPMPIRRRITTSAIGMTLMLLIDSSACVLIMSWSYIFLPDRHAFTPFLVSPLRDNLIGFLYNFYNGVGTGIIPIIVWALASIRKADLTSIVEKLQARQSIASNRVDRKDGK